jgi:hypothetical protein
MLAQEEDLSRQLDGITANLRPYVKTIVRKMAKTNPENRAILCDHINSELIERNIAEVQEWKIKTLTWLSAYFQRARTFRAMTKQDILLYLNSLRKTVDARQALILMEATTVMMWILRIFRTQRLRRI